MTPRPLLLADKVTVLARADGVFIEFRDLGDVVIAVAGLEIEAAVDFNELVIAACERVLRGQTAPGAVH